MNYSSNATVKKVSVTRKKIILSWLICFVIGCCAGHATRTTPIIQQEPVEQVNAVVVNAEEYEPEPQYIRQMVDVGEFKITAYCGCMQCCGKTDKITASGERATEGITIAADQDLFPFGTIISIDGHEYTVQDTGGAIKGNRIDVYFEEHQDALNFGVQHKHVYVIKEGEEI